MNTPTVRIRSQRNPLLYVLLILLVCAVYGLADDYLKFQTAQTNEHAFEMQKAISNDSIVKRVNHTPKHIPTSQFRSARLRVISIPNRTK